MRGKRSEKKNSPTTIEPAFPSFLGKERRSLFPHSLHSPFALHGGGEEGERTLLADKGSSRSLSLRARGKN